MYMYLYKPLFTNVKFYVHVRCTLKNTLGPNNYINSHNARNL